MDFNYKFSLGNFGPVVEASATCIAYAGFCTISMLFQKYGSSVDIAFMAMTYILVFIFMIGAILTWFFLPTPERILSDSGCNKKISARTSEISTKSSSL